MNQLPKFYVGQKVVAIRNHSQGRFKIGDTFTVLANITNTCCNIPYLVDVGLPSLRSYLRCACGSKQPSGPKHLIGDIMFAPVVQIEFPLMTYSKVIERELVSAN